MRITGICRHCGDREGSRQAHYIASPSCWEADQQELAVRYAKRYGSIKKLRCYECGRAVYSKMPKLYCSFCLKARKDHRQKLRRAAAKVTSIDCAHCGTTFEPVRSDAKFCKPACRQAAHRARVTPLEFSNQSQNSAAVTALEFCRRRQNSTPVTGTARMGELLKSMEMKAGRPKQNGSHAEPLSLSAAGVTKKQSSRAQKIASLPKKVVMQARRRRAS